MRSGNLTVGTIGRRSIVAIALSGFALSRISRPDEQPIVVDRLARVVIVAGDLDRLARFYATLGFAVDDARPAPDYASLANAGRARVRRMELGSEFAELVAFDPPGQPYPRPGRSTDPWFQHISLIAADMRMVMDQLQRAEGWTAISRSGPVHLPEALTGRTGGVTVFKFRDPEGHPLEFASFAEGHAPDNWSGAGPGLLGYDHSGLGVTDVSRSISFYRNELGMKLGPRTLNQGPEQEAADDVANVAVDIVNMLPSQGTPHVEFLGYRNAPGHESIVVGPTDRAATRLVLAGRGVAAPMLKRDPDGHWLQLEMS